MSDVTIRQLQVFASAAKTRNFTRTSEELHLTQPAVSMQIKQLEDCAGAPLFERVGRHVGLTQAGEEMARTARRVLAALQDAEDRFAALRGLEIGRLHIAVVSTAKYFAPKLVATFCHQRPGIEMKLSVRNREAVVELLAANEVDVVLMGRQPPEVDSLAYPFARHPLVVVAAPDHPLARRKRVPITALRDEVFIVREEGSGSRAAMEAFFAEHDLRVRVGMEITSNETIKQAVMAGMGLAFISQHTLGLELATGKLALVHAAGLPVMRTWHVVHRREKQLSPAAEAFKHFVLETGGPFLDAWPGA